MERGGRISFLAHPGRKAIRKRWALGDARKRKVSIGEGGEANWRELGEENCNS